jgi:hypothetical protein
MAKTLCVSQREFKLELDRDELSMVKLHREREGLDWGEALADIVEHALATLATDIDREEKEARGTHTEESCTIMLHIMYPVSGPLSKLDATDKGLIASLLLETLNFAVSTAMHSHRMEETVHGMERKDERVGSGESAIPQHGRGVNHVHGSGGPGSAQGEVQG